MIDLGGDARLNLFVKRILQKNTDEAEIEALQEAIHSRKRFKNIVLGICLASAAGLIGYLVIWPRAREWRQERSLVEAEKYEKNGDYRRALLILEQTVQLYPGNVEAKRRLANFLERLGQRQALQAWQELVAAHPGDSQNLIGLARAGLRFGQLGVTREALAQIKQAGNIGPEYHRLAAGLALVAHDNAALEASLAELARIEPADLRVQLNLAVVRIRSSEVSKAEAGRAALVALARSEGIRIRAVVELLNDLARRWPRPSAERVAAFQELARLLTPPQGPRSNPSEIADPIERLVWFAMRQRDPEPEDAGALLSWLVLNGRAAAGFAWVETLPPATRDSPLVAAAASEAALQTKDWPRLHQSLLAGAWGMVPATAVNGAFAVRDRRASGASAVDANEWTAVIESCQTSLTALRMVLRLTEAWQWPEEQRQVLIAITRAFAAETWAWRQLLSFALARGDAEQVWQIYQRWSRAAPGEIGVQVETAIMGHLLQERAAPATTATAELVRLQPGNPGALVAHALGLWRSRQLDQALALLEPLPATVFAEPRYALAYGVMLAEAGRAIESEKLLNRAAVDRLLPVELLLIEQARARNQLRRAPGGRQPGEPAASQGI
jgi:tetratricopeptide (TPR) repeat protein